MAEIGMVGDPVYTIPWDRFTSFPVPKNAFNFILFGGDELMASGTLLHRGDSSDIGPHHIRMAIETLNPIFGVGLVAEGDGLRGSCQCNPPADKHSRQQKQDQAKCCGEKEKSPMLSDESCEFLDH
jgi:hypothetical protein